MADLLSVSGLSVAFADDAAVNTYVDQVSFRVREGETVCIVGESGCGKSVTVLSVMGLLGEGGRVTAGQVLFNGKELLSMPETALDRVRGNELTMIFQDATSSLNPVFTIGNQITETIRAHLRLPRREASARAAALLQKVGLSDPQKVMRKYPHTLSGGMRQRVMIAMALSCNPRLLIADEPTTALDVTIQAQIMRLLAQLKQEYRMALLLITHDMGLVAEMADRVLVMYAGQVVEEADVLTLFTHPKHPYTQALLQSVPSLRDGAGRRLHSIGGTVPEHYEALAGCRFYNRCAQAVPACAQMPQAMASAGHGSFARCWLAAESAAAPENTAAATYGKALAATGEATVTYEKAHVTGGTMAVTEEAGKAANGAAGVEAALTVPASAASALERVSTTAPADSMVMIAGSAATDSIATGSAVTGSAVMGSAVTATGAKATGNAETTAGSTQQATHGGQGEG